MAKDQARGYSGIGVQKDHNIHSLRGIQLKARSCVRPTLIIGLPSGKIHYTKAPSMKNEEIFTM